MEVTKALHALIAKATVGLKGNDILAVTYQTLTAIEGLAKRARDSLKSDILSKTDRDELSNALARVKKYDRSESIQILVGKQCMIVGQIKCGPTYLDTDALRDELGLSTKRWEKAVVAATKRREPTLTLVVSERP